MGVLPEELIARAAAGGYKHGAYEERDSQANQEKYVNNTTAMHATVLNRYATWHWHRAVGTAEKLNAAPPDFTTTRAFVLRKNAPAPNMTEVKDFFRFYIASSCGRIAENGRPTAESMVSRAEAFYRAFKHETGTETDPQQHTEIYRWMRRVLTAEGVLEDKKKEKHNLNRIALDRLLHAIWSDLTVPHERVRIQLHLLFMLYVTTGARIGALFAGNVTYKDIEIVQTRREGSGYRFFWRFDQRFVKNNRNTENDTFGSSARDHDVLLYCATALLLSLAFADDAMFGFDSLESLYELEIPEGDNEIILRWNEDVLDLPIVRGIARDGTVTSKQLTESSFRQSFNKALKLAGYVGVSPSIHQIRRYLGKQVDERYTEVERSQHLTQSDRNIFGASYVANCSSVDGLGAFLGEKSDHTAVNFFQGLEKFREQGAPIVLPAAIERALWQKEEVVELQQRIDLSEDSIIRSKLVGALRNLRRKLKAKALESYRQQWVRERRDWKVLTRGKIAPELSTAEGNQLVNFLPELERVEKLMLSMSPLSPESMRQAMQDLYVLASKGFTILYYPGEEPVAGECRFCGIDMSSIHERSRSSHAHRCCRVHLANERQVLQTDLHFCYMCAEWFVKGEQWSDHCKSHLDPLPKICGSIELRRTLVHPAHCPWCLAGQNNDPAKRMRHWKRDADVIRHIKADELRNTYPASCPLCSEILLDEDAVDCHLHDAHLLKIPSKTRKRKRADEGNLAPDLGHLHPRQGPLESGTSLFVHEYEVRGEKNKASPCYTLSDEQSDIWGHTGDADIGLLPSDPAVNPTLDEFMGSCIEFPLSPQPPSNFSSEYTVDEDGPVFGTAAPVHSFGLSDGGLDVDAQSIDARPRKIRIVLRSKEAANGNNADETTGYGEMFPDDFNNEESLSDMTLCDDPVTGSEFSSEAFGLVSGSDSKFLSSRTPIDLTGMPTRSPRTHHHQNSLHYGIDRVTEPCPKEDDTFTVDCILGRWGSTLFFLKWDDGSHSWEPRENVLDDQLVENFEDKYKGFREGVDVLKTRTRNGKMEYMLHWTGRPDREDSWVAEKYMSPELVSRHRPPVKQKRKTKRTR